MLSDVQSILLERAAQVVKPGGRLVYSTCSLEREENEIIDERFLENAADFKLGSPDAYPDLESEGGIIRTFPHRRDMDGVFAAVFERKKSQGACSGTGVSACDRDGSSPSRQYTLLLTREMYFTKRRNNPS